MVTVQIQPNANKRKHTFFLNKKRKKTKRTVRSGERWEWECLKSEG